MSTVHSPRYRQFLKKLRAARLDAGLTQQEVARALRKPQSFVSKCESGERRVDVVELERFARLYGKRLEDFLQ
ncbi:MAG: helix-turn-helix domain-containing protein [Gemmatimonadales bacterium]